MLTSIEICAGAGGQALGLEQAGFEHLLLLENDPDCYQTLASRRRWRKAARRIDIQDFSAARYAGQVDLLAGGVPCPPFSRAGKRLGADDERDLFPEALRLVRECEPRAIMLENVKNLMTSQFDGYREDVLSQLDNLGYEGEWKRLNASDFGVPQLRPRAILVALRKGTFMHFRWPEKTGRTRTVGEVLEREMAAAGWEGASDWAAGAQAIAPTLVGGSKKHGGADLGPTQAKLAWEKLGVNGHLLADAPPQPGFQGDPKLTVKMAGIIQGFPADWPFSGRKTASYRQVGNAFPPPVARAVGEQIARALDTDAALAGATGRIIVRREVVRSTGLTVLATEQAQGERTPASSEIAAA